MTAGCDSFHRLFHHREQGVGEARIQVQHAPLRDRRSLLAQGPVEPGIERDHGQGAVRSLVLTRNRPPQRLARHFREEFRIFGGARVIGQSFDDRTNVADRNAFVEQIAKNANDRSKRQQGGNEFFHQFGMSLRQFVEERLHLLPAQQFMPMPLDDF